MFMLLVVFPASALRSTTKMVLEPGIQVRPVRAMPGLGVLPCPAEGRWACAPSACAQRRKRQHCRRQQPQKGSAFAIHTFLPPLPAGPETPCSQSLRSGSGDIKALPEFGFSVTPIAALGGLASVALGFAAQNLIRDVINGFLIVFEDQYVVGEKIRVGEALGCVEHFTLRRTVLRNEKGSLVTLANGEIRQVANLSRDWAQLYVDVQVAAEEPVDTALAALEKVASELRADPKWSAALVEGPQVLGVEALTLSGATLRVQVRTLPDRQDDVARELRRRIQLRFEREQIRLTGVQRVELVGTARSSEAEISGHLTQK